jgi:hypothetical protein
MRGCLLCCYGDAGIRGAQWEAVARERVHLQLEKQKHAIIIHPPASVHAANGGIPANDNKGIAKLNTKTGGNRDNPAK